MTTLDLIYLLYMPKLSSDEKRQALLEAITKKDIPEHIAEYALDQNPSMAIYFLYGLFFLIVLILGFIAGAVLNLGPLQSIANNNAANHASEIGAIFYITNYGFYRIIALFGWIFCTGAISSLLPLCMSEKKRASCFVHVVTDAGGAMFKPKNNNLPPSEYIKKGFAKSAKLYTIPSVILMLSAGFVGIHELKSYKVLGPSQFVISPAMPLKAKQIYTLEDVSHIELGCNHVTGKNASDDLVYKINFKSEKSIQMEDAMPLTGTWLENAIEIDQALRNKGVEFKRWSWLSRNPLHPACLKAQKARHTAEEFDQILELLQVDKFKDLN